MLQRTAVDLLSPAGTQCGELGLLRQEDVTGSQSGTLVQDGD